MMRKYECCLDTCSLYVSGDTYIRREKIWMDGDGYRGKDTRPHTVCATPTSIATMEKVQDFVAGLTKSGKSAAKIKKTINAAYEDKAWRLTFI